MWRRLLHRHLPGFLHTGIERIQENDRLASGLSRAGRRRWRVENLERRLLLSADLLPAADDLHILGTAGDDAVLVRTLEPEDGSAPQLEVTLNDVSFKYTIEAGQTIHIDLLGGNDLLNGQITVAGNWDFVLGDGDDRTQIETLIGDVFATAHYRLDAGSGDNATEVRFGDGQYGQKPPTGESHITAEYRSGAGNDSLTFGWFVHLDRPLIIDVDAETGAGDDRIVQSWEHQHEFRTGKATSWDYNFEVGEGSDEVELRVKPGEGLDALGAEVRVTADPDDRGRAKIATAEAGGHTLGETEVSGAEKLRLETGSGDDRVEVDDLTGALRPIRLEVVTGAGDDEYLYLPTGRLAEYLRQSFGEGLHWTIFDAGEGNDRFAVATADRAELIEISGMMIEDIPDPVLHVTDLATTLGTLQASVVGAESIDVKSAGGDDHVTMTDAGGPLAGIAFGIELGAGDDFLEAALDPTPASRMLDAASSTIGIIGGDGFDRFDLTTGDAADRLIIEGLDADSMMGDQPGLRIHIAPPDPVGISPYQILPYIEQDNLYSRFGDDQILVKLDQFAVPLPEVNFDAGAGNDTVGIHVAGEFDRFLIGLLLGDGDDSATIDIDTTAAAAAVRLGVDVDAGLGVDHVGVDVKGVFKAFLLNVDLGADPSDHPLPTETLSLNYQEINWGYTKGSHEYENGKPDVPECRLAQYRYAFSSDGEQVETTYSISTKGGKVDDAVDIRIDSSSTELAGTFVGVNVSDSTETVDRSQIINIYPRTGSVATDIRVDIQGIDNLSMASAVNINVNDTAGDEEPANVVSIFQDNRRTAEAGVVEQISVLSGAGDDALELILRSHALGVETAVDLNIDLGAGADALKLDAFSDLKASAEMANVLFKAHILSVGTLFWTTLFPMGTLEMSQAIQDDRAGKSSASLDFLLDATDLTALIRTAAANDDLTITPALQTSGTSVQVTFDGGAGRDAVGLDAGATEEASFSKVLGLNSEVTIAEYRAGVEGGGGFTAKIDLVRLESLFMKTGNGEDEFLVDIDHPTAPAPEVTVCTRGGNDRVKASFAGGLGEVAFNLDTGDGNDDVDVNIAESNVGTRAEFIRIHMGTGADEVSLNWHGAIQDSLADLHVAVQIDFGGADPGQPDSSDTVLVTFMNGDPSQPLIIGGLWNSEDTPGMVSKGLRVDLANVGGIVQMSGEIIGGAGTDDMQLFFQGKLTVGAIPPQVNIQIDPGAGDDRVLIDFAELEIEESTRDVPIVLTVQGGTGHDTLRVTGTDGADRFAVNESTVMLEGIAGIDYDGFESLRVDALAGDDTVSMTGIDPVTFTTLDGGDGRDRFVGRFDSGFDGNLTLLNFEQTVIRVRGFFSGTITPDAARFDPEETLSLL